MNGLIPRDYWMLPTKRIQSILDEFDDDLALPLADSASGLSVSEDDTNVYVEAAIPGVDPDDVEVTLNQGTLWIRGEAQKEEQDKKRKFYRRAVQSFSYRVAVPGDIDPAMEIQAEAENGVLRLIIPKAASSQPQKITVNRSDVNREGETGRTRGTASKKNSGNGRSRKSL